MSEEPPYLMIIARSAFRVVLLGLALFLPGGCAGWTAGWLYLAAYAGWTGANIVLLGRRQPGLLRRREAETIPATLPWDKFFIAAGVPLLGALLLVSSAEGPAAGFTPLSAAALAGVIAGYSLYSWALLSNRFAIGVISIQEGQVTADQGPYRAVRHPLNLGAIIILACTPAALGAVSAYVPAGLLAVLVIFRTAMEDRLLLRSLQGYAAYAGRVRYRLVPGIW